VKCTAFGCESQAARAGREVPAAHTRVVRGAGARGRVEGGRCNAGAAPVSPLPPQSGVRRLPGGSMRRRLRALALLLLARAASAAVTVSSRIDTAQTQYTNDDYTRTSCLLNPNTRTTGEVSLPVGGKLYVRLLGECDYCNQINQIDNTKYGFPGTAQTTSMTQRGWLAFAPTEQFAGNSYDVCAKTVAEDVDYYTCMKVRVRAHRAQFIDDDVTAPAPAGNTVIDAAVGRSLEIPFPVDSLIDGGCDFSGALEPNPCRLEPPPPNTNTNGTRGQIACAVLKHDSACNCDNVLNDGECVGPCECMTECPLGPLASVKVLADMSYPKSASGLPEGATLSLQTLLPDGSPVTPQVCLLRESVGV